MNENEFNQKLDELPESSRAIVELLVWKIEDSNRTYAELLKQRDNKIVHLEQENNILKRRMNLFEKKLDDIESKDLKLNLILSGDGVPMESHEENTKRTTIALIKDKLKVIIKSPEIVSATRIGSRPNSQRPNRRPIKIVLQDNEVKNSILSACKTAKPENLYFNEDLTPKRRSFLYCLRQAKGKFPSLISGTMTRDNKVYVFVKPTGIVTIDGQ